MEEIVAKKYAYALIKSCDNDALKKLAKIFSQVSQAFGVEKFIDIIHSPYVPKAKKKEFLLSLLGGDKQAGDFVNLLIENNRLDILPFVADILEGHLRGLANSYKAVLYAPSNLDSSTISNIAQNLSKKLGIHLDIEQSSSKVDGIQLKVEDLGIEISFLKNRFFDDLKNRILKAI